MSHLLATRSHIGRSLSTAVKVTPLADRNCQLADQPLLDLDAHA